MHPSVHAKTHPDKPAFIMASTGAVTTYKQLDEASNRVAQLLRTQGLKTGDSIAICMENNPHYLALTWGAQRSGLYYTCISARLTAGETAYIVKDCGAKAFFSSEAMGAGAREMPAQLSGVTCYMVGGAAPGYKHFEEAQAAMPSSPIADESSGADMLYSSGTTGRPKGVKHPLTGAPITEAGSLLLIMKGLFGIDGTDTYLSPAPLYHAAPLRYVMAMHRLGGTTVLMEHFDPEQALALIETHKITCSQWVPTMFVRMLKLPDAARAKHNLSSHKAAIHAAAPCPMDVKRRMIDWWGPIIHEYYAGTEGNGFVYTNATDWLAHPGTVGRAILGEIHIVGEDGEDVPVGQEGQIYFANGTAFEYHNDPKKTAESRNAKGWTSLGDVGRLDAEGFLYLTDRKAFMIISGGVNVYPQETENLLIGHPKVADVAVIGVPNEDFGEEVKAVVQPVDWADAGPALAEELIAFCRQHLSPIKCPRTVDFDKELPRHPTGKLYKRLVRDRYWGNKDSKIV
jgi:long-chain acyl-CoA synthetase